MAQFKRRTKRFWRRVLIAIPIVLLAVFLYLLVRPPSRAPASGIRVDMSPDRVARGRYLYTALCACDACHSERDYSRFGSPAAITGQGAGQIIPLGDLPGRIVASNITPDVETGIGSWSDGEKIRAIREGVGKDGHALFPLMPYQAYHSMSDPDVEALVAYMDTLAPVRHALPKTEVTFPASTLIKALPEPESRPVPPADSFDGEVFGEYLATLAGCESCHTPQKRLTPDFSLRLAGGRLFSTPYGSVISPNITPDKDTGIGSWNYLRFATRMQTYRQFQNGQAPKAGPEQFTLMPWEAYAKLGDRDLEYMYLYLQSRTPISHKVVMYPK